MPMLGQFIQDINPTDMVFGLGGPIEKFYKFCEGRKGVKLNKNNQGQYFLMDDKKVDNYISKPDSQPKQGYAKYESEGLNRNKEYLRDLASGTIPKQIADKVKSGKKIARRKCKSLLYWQLIERKLPVHFLISEMNLDAVPKKAIVHKDKTRLADGTARLPENSEIGVTDAELRWVFRNRENEFVKTGIQFWDQGLDQTTFVPCGPPWENPAYMNAWLEYDLRVRQKEWRTLEWRKELSALDPEWDRILDE